MFFVKLADLHCKEVAGKWKRLDHRNLQKPTIRSMRVFWSKAFTHLTSKSDSIWIQSVMQFCIDRKILSLLIVASTAMTSAFEHSICKSIPDVFRAFLCKKKTKTRRRRKKNKQEEHSHCFLKKQHDLRFIASSGYLVERPNKHLSFDIERLLWHVKTINSPPNNDDHFKSICFTLNG